MATKRTTKTAAGKAASARKQGAARGGEDSGEDAGGSARGNSGSTTETSSGASGGRSSAGGSGAASARMLGAGGAQGKVLTPEEAFKMYRANAQMALEIIDAAIEETAKFRRFQFENEESARSMQKRAARTVAEANDPQSMLAAGQNATREAMQKAMNYWREMFDLCAQMQKRLFTLIEGQMSGVPGVKETKAALTMLPDLSQAQNLVNAMQGVWTSGGATFASMQKAMSDLARFAQGSTSGGGSSNERAGGR